MHQLLQNVKNATAEIRTKNLARYRELLVKEDSATEAESQEIAELAVALGKPTSEIEADLRAIHRLAELEKFYAREPDLKVKYDAAKKDRDTFINKMLETVEQLKARRDELVKVCNDAEMRYHGSRRSINEIREIKRTHWELLGLPPVSCGDHEREPTVA